MLSQKNSHLYNASFIDELYETYLANPSQVNDGWRHYFAALQDETPLAQDTPHGPIQDYFAKLRSHHSAYVGVSAETFKEFAKKQVAVLRLINAYRFRGHQQADLDPLKLQERPYVDELNPEFYGLNEADLHTIFNTGSLYGPSEAKLSDILERLKKVYCGTLGAEYMHITETKQKRWIQKQLENPEGKNEFDSMTQLHILRRLTAAQGLEDYLHSQYVGQKRFSLEGGESLIPLLDELIEEAGMTNVKEIVLGMAHRGRLNVLVNILGKRPKDLFSEFEGKVTNETGSGDVKYHQGFSSNVATASGALHVTLAFNPSHLEIINPVVEGSVRARQERLGDKTRNHVIPVLIHGDSAVAGQGVVMETLNLGGTHGYGTGGTIHIIINNQIGFTTSDPLDSRSTLYCTDVFKMVQAPIFHVNGDDPEMVLFATRIAFAYRMAFNKDVVVDLICYRRRGHNEADEPFATQPMMYTKISEQFKTQALYATKLIERGIIGVEEGEMLLQQYRASLKTKDVVVPRALAKGYKNIVNWKPYVGTNWTMMVDTCLSEERVRELVGKLTKIPKDFHLHRSVEKLVEARQKMGEGELPLDWGCAEALAFASLLEEGYPIRLSGQDSARGTFAHRHSVLHDCENGNTFIPLRHLSASQAPFLVINSLLSEEAVLAFEYGYSSSEPDTLVIWEAQFGDFANGAQVVIDQFLTSSEAKWQRLCGLVMLLPHGYDGQGPEHSSARLERYLQLCAEENIQVCIPSTPGQFFHMIRRQMKRPYRKPLIVMTPKSLLRHKAAVSQFSEFTGLGFYTVIDEVDANIVPEKVRRLLFCTGKVYYDLVEARSQHNIIDIAIIRLEQLYPYPKYAVGEILKRYPHVTSRVWVQEEPRNQGAWWYIRAHMDVNLSHDDLGRIEYAGRPSSASPAAGYLQIHRKQLQDLLNDALELNKEEK